MSLYFFFIVLILKLFFWHNEGQRNDEQTKIILWSYQTLMDKVKSCPHDFQPNVLFDSEIHQITEVKYLSDLSRSLFSWRSSSYGTCVRSLQSTQLQVETAKTVRKRRFEQASFFWLDFVLMLQPDLCLLQLLDWGASAQVGRGHESARGVTERQPCPTSVLLWRGMKHMTPDLQNIWTSSSVSLRVCVCVQVISLVLQGRTDEARQVLSRQASLRAESSSVFKRMDGLLQTMPIFNVRTSGHNMHLTHFS